MQGESDRSSSGPRVSRSQSCVRNGGCAGGMSWRSRRWLSVSAPRYRICRDLQAEIKHQFVQRSPVPGFRVCLPQAEANPVADVVQKSFQRYEAVTITQEDPAAEACLVGPGEQLGVVLAV